MNETELIIVLVCGDRNWSGATPIRRELKKLVKKYGTRDLLVVSGGAPGADTIAEYVSKELNVHIAVIDALWETRYRGAGPQRNTMMRRLEPSEYLAFHADLSKSRGTKDMINQLKRSGVPGRLISK